MRNTTMRDKLVGVLGESDVPLEILEPQPRKKTKTGRIPKTINLAEATPRYIPPPRRANPFAVHTFSSQPYVVEDRSMEEPPETVPAIEEPPEEPIGEEPAPEEPQAPPAEVEPEIETNPAPIPSAAPPVEEPLPAFEPPALPPNLAWLDKPTPFSGNLSAIIESLRSARTLCACTLEEARARRKQKQEALDSEDYLILQQQEYLKSIENTMSACALVAEQSIGIEPRLLAPKSPHEKKPAKVNAEGKRTITMPDKDDPTILRVDEIRKFFAANPNTNWTVNEIVSELPAHKRKHGKIYLSGAMAFMATQGEIERVGRGIYRKQAE